MATFVSYSAYNTMIDENMKRKEKKRKEKIQFFEYAYYFSKDMHEPEIQQN